MGRRGQKPQTLKNIMITPVIVFVMEMENLLLQDILVMVFYIVKMVLHGVILQHHRPAPFLSYVMKMDFLYQQH